MKSKRKGFTLVEVVVVVVVVLVLVAIVIARFGRVTENARNAVIHNFLKDCRTVYVRLSYGQPPGYVAITNVVSLKDYVAGTTLGEVQAQLNGNALVLSQIPESIFKDKRTTLSISYPQNTYDGEGEDVFLGKVLW
ncbi:MAG TPA: prepilin-type N-terminal cleavage/methylation domain-containing protein [Verrucomicrobiota bacterium]|jgi:prepilin-type N-terminal cleavage/methylation domain-containing protein|nr:prepilin-type N-terminal cleavage/methylation domain-containing protein [Verrucomicrobiota bacterium]HQL76587.1 prepilin-type N-terminal cleavage/methylation domain-containing protein [Verrucomicrobiota bacterium]